MFCFWFFFLAHLSRKHKWAVLIKICPLSVVVFVVVVVVLSNVNFFTFHLLLQKNWANFKQTWHKPSSGEWENEGPYHFPKGDNYEKRKYIDEIKKILLSRTTGPISTKLGTNHPWMKGIQVCSNEEPTNSHKFNLILGFVLFLTNFIIIIIMCVYSFELFSQVNDLAHVPLVFWLGKIASYTMY